MFGAGSGNALQLNDNFNKHVIEVKNNA